MGSVACRVCRLEAFMFSFESVQYFCFIFAIHKLTLFRRAAFLFTDIFFLDTIVFNLRKITNFLFLHLLLFFFCICFLLLHPENPNATKKKHLPLSLFSRSVWTSVVSYEIQSNTKFLIKKLYICPPQRILPFIFPPFKSVPF